MPRSIYYLLVSGLIMSIIACESEQNDSLADSLFRTVKSSQSNIKFNNKIQEDVDFHHLNWESIYNGGGVAVADFDNDGLEDIYFTGNQVNDALYKNEGNMQFKDVSKAAGINKIPGWSTGASVADVNGDGYLDIYISRMWHAKDGVDEAKRKNLLYINNKDFTFSESAAKYGLADIGHGTQASFFDYDQDGDLDMFMLNAPSNNYNQKLTYIRANKIPYVCSDKLYRNDNGKFTDVTKQSGIEDYGFGLGVTTQDFNGDGWTDIYVANDFEIADRYLINQKDGTFLDQVKNSLKHISFSSMGTDAADINNDGMLDIAVLDMQSADHYRSKTNMPSMDVKQFWTNVARGQHYQFMSNMLQINNGYGFYTEVAQLAGIASTDWSWSILLADLDNDSRRDIYITNGLNKDIRNNDFAEEMKKYRSKGPKDLFDFSQKVGSEKIANLVYRNVANSLQFTDKSKDWGLDHKGFSYGSAYADLDNDGDLDLVVNNNNAEASLYENQSVQKSQNHFVQFLVTENGVPKENVQIFAYNGNETYLHEQSRIRGFQSSVSMRSHFGLGASSSLDSVIIKYRGNKVHKVASYKIDALNVLKIEDFDWKVRVDKAARPTLLREITNQSSLRHKHVENPYNDFNRESLLPHMQSKNGPFLTSSTDGENSFIFISGSHGNPSNVYQRKAGTFTKISGPWEADLASEDQDGAFADVDGDGDLDLIIASGGGEKAVNDQLYRDRLYINQGETWVKSNALPDNPFNSSIVRVADFDGDGDQDLFIGGHSVPGRYPLASPSQLLINNEGDFSDKTIEIASALRKVGIVNDALWIDLNDDKLLDLVVVGEFMAPQFYENNGRQLIDKSSNYLKEDLAGWWFSMKEADLDGDGVSEILLGNIGDNNKYHPSVDKPLSIYGNDFDKNNTNDIVLTKTTKEYGEVPVRGRQCSSEQMPFIKNKFKDFEGYANANVLDIFGQKGLNEGINLKATEFSSGYLKRVNDGYKFIAFPDPIQVSAVRDMEVDDLNYDGKMDIIFVGNLYDAEVETTRHDASNGIVLLQKSDGTFDVVNVRDSGLYAPGNSRKITKLVEKNKTTFLVSNNGFVTQVIEKNPKR